jgi:hypothetical protein
MPEQITGHCDAHPFDSSSGICSRCGAEGCESCIVRPFGNRKAICVGCALVTAGVRRSNTKAISRRERKRREQEQREAVAGLHSETAVQWVKTEVSVARSST